MTPEISSLPSEVLTHIFKFLNVHHRLVACRVCKKWLNAINCRQLLCDVKIKLGSNINERIKVFYHMTRQFQCFWFCSIIIDDCILDFLQKYSNQFVTLFFIACKINPKIYDILPCTLLQCDNLKHLSIAYSKAIVLFASIPNLTILEIDFRSYLTDYIVLQLTKSVFKLEKLSLGIKGFCRDEESETIYFNGETMENNPFNSVLTFSGIQLLFEKNRNTLTSIDLLALQLSPFQVRKMCEIRGLKLRLVKCDFNVELKYVKKFCENQFYLRSLDVSSISGVTNEAVCAFCKHLPNLQELAIIHNSLINNCVIEIFQMEHLEVLYLSNSVGISEVSYQEAISNLKAFKLRRLNLKESKISDKSLFELLKRNQNIRKLDISYTNVSNKTLNMISQNLIHLEHLDIDSCTKISDEGLTGECEFLSNTFKPTTLSNLKEMRCLSLMNNPSITSSGILKVIRFPHLKYLFLTESDGLIFDNDFLTQIYNQNPLLVGDKNNSLSFGIFKCYISNFINFSENSSAVEVYETLLSLQTVINWC